jgi:tetratricopeptide (TPR) repeat protein
MNINTKEEQTKLCFVIMGFGKKTDYKSGKTLNLDATYNEIIRPAVEDCGVKCIRADEVCHSGSIDREMYHLLYRADIVIADISTNNANALYELGVRHTLKKGTTIIMSEECGDLYFDLNHTATLRYEHLGEDIGCSEARKKKLELTRLIEIALVENKTDSPIYTYIPEMTTPVLSDSEIKEIVEESNVTEQEWYENFNRAEDLLKKGNFSEAKQLYTNALEIRPNDSYLVQRLTLCTYKDVSDSSSIVKACFDAMSILSSLSPEVSNDPETTGLAGAINKTIWREIRDVAFLDTAIAMYGRGYALKKDYYNGENLAICHHEKSKYLKSLTDDHLNDIIYNEVSVEKTLYSVLNITEGIINSVTFSERNDKKWVYASAANAAGYLFESSKEKKYLSGFYELCDNTWDVDTLLKNKLVRS